MKKLKAIKCKDAWLVEISETFIITAKSDVLKLVKQHGLTINKASCQPYIKSNQYILAE